MGRYMNKDNVLSKKVDELWWRMHYQALKTNKNILTLQKANYNGRI